MFDFLVQKRGLGLPLESSAEMVAGVMGRSLMDCAEEEGSLGGRSWKAAARLKSCCIGK